MISKSSRLCVIISFQCVWYLWVSHCPHSNNLLLLKSQISNIYIYNHILQTNLNQHQYQFIIIIKFYCNFCPIKTMSLIATETQFHVLAVDDSIIDRKLIERLLKTSSYQVTAVESGVKALEFLGLLDDQNTNTTLVISFIHALIIIS